MNASDIYILLSFFGINHSHLSHFCFANVRFFAARHAIVGPKRETLSLIHTADHRHLAHTEPVFSPSFSVFVLTHQILHVPFISISVITSLFYSTMFEHDQSPIRFSQSCIEKSAVLIAVDRFHANTRHHEHGRCKLPI
jgi:hypothetical protein